jgi:aminopeptidase N
MQLPDTTQAKKLAAAQFKQSLTTNMTDTMGALRALNSVSGAERETVLSEFYQQWQGNALVVDKWFALQAVTKLPGALDDVKKLLKHPAFDIKNPNKVYALLGAFGHQNLFHFHAANGEGYEFLAEMVQQLDSLNPQVAARMLQPLISWKRYDKKRQELMKQQLENIAANKKLSKDVYELVSKSI